MIKLRALLLTTILLCALTVQQGLAQVADSLFVATDNGTQQDTLINTLNTADSVVVVDSLAFAESFVDSSAVVQKAVRDTSRYGLYRAIFIDNDSLKIHKWQYNPNTYDLQTTTYDSVIDMLNLYKPANKDGRVTANLYQVGTAIQSHNYFNPNPQTRFLFLQSFTPYMHQAETEEFYNVKKPFTFFGYNGGKKEEQCIEVLHTQNATKALNLFFKYNSYGGDGEYVSQKTRNNAGSLGGSYIKGRFATHAAWTFSKINVEENGGIVDEYLITDSIMAPREIAVRLTNGKNYIKDRQWLIDQKIGFVRAKESDTVDTGGYWFSLQYTYKRQNSWKRYTDAVKQFYNPMTGDSVPVYQHNYTRKNTYDSCSYVDNIHQIRLNLEEIKNPFAPFGLYGALGVEKARYYYFNVDTLFDNSHKATKSSSYFEAGLYRTRPGLLTFSGSYRQYLSGYRMGDFVIGGEMKQRFSKAEKPMSLSAECLFEQRKPDYFLTNYQSNHYKWNRDFSSRPMTANVNVTLDLPKWRTTLKGNYKVLNNYIYLNTECKPEQADEAFSVVGVELKNHLCGAGFNLVSRVNYQMSSNDNVLPLPELTAYEALYYERELYFKVTEGRMLVQLGLDMTFWTKYQAQAYSPAVALFHNQNYTQTGGYPFVGAFLNVRIKQVRFFVYGQHLNYDLFDNHHSFLAPNYPASRIVVNYGVRWNFYD